MRKFAILVVILLLTSSALFAQVSITTDYSAPDNSAMFDVKSTNKGMLVPRMTQTEIEAIVNPANGLVVFCTSSNTFFSYISHISSWKEIAFGSNSINPGGGFICGSSITINHLASGGVAPVDKTVMYGTANNIPGEPAKCWITRNLGAGQQAIGFSDATETSAGWYWQFNRKQGYQYISSRIPNSSWVTSISESSNWIAANDPCLMELGPGWRIPTYTEWTHVDATGGWGDWYGTYGSALKLHAAGILNNSNGSLSLRGSNGDYWTSVQNDATNSWYLGLAYNICSMYLDSKAYGFSVRCLKDN
ncbi:MAG: hypothetical protein NTW16_13380 [Bacteroidetes bacterium]|nr:hypothetical protein [Bacteroidota bacterium]